MGRRWLGAMAGGALIAASTLAQGTDVAGPPAPRRKVVISDLHLGPGKNAQGRYEPTEDFRFGPSFVRFLKAIGGDGGTDLIIAGDFIDFWQIQPQLDPQENPYEGPIEAHALTRIRQAIAQHREVFDGLAGFLTRKENHLVLIPGNHDGELLFPAVQQELRKTLDPDGSGRYELTVSGVYDDHGVYVEHGYRYDPLNDFGDRYLMHEKDRPIDTFTFGEREAWYVNAGCWQRTLPVSEAERRGVAWKSLNLDEASLFPDEFTYVMIEYQNRRPLRPKRLLWR